MTPIKEKAVEMIRYMPDDSMNLIITMPEAVSEYADSISEKKTGCLDAFFYQQGV